MNRKQLWASVGGGVVVASGLLGGTLWALQPTKPPAGPETAKRSDAPAAQLPIGRVVLFSSGVGYFQREGQVEGNARVDLSFDVFIFFFVFLLVFGSIGGFDLNFELVGAVRISRVAADRRVF